MEIDEGDFTSTSTSFLTPPSSPLSFDDVVFNVPGQVADVGESIEDLVFRACEEHYCEEHEHATAEVVVKKEVVVAPKKQRCKKSQPAVSVKRPPLGMSEVTGVVLKKIRNEQPISWVDLKTEMFAQYSGDAMRRRIYDAINILVGSGVLVKFRSDKKVTMLATSANFDQQLVLADKQEQIRVLTQELVRRTSLVITTPEGGGETADGEPNLMIETNDDSSIVVLSCCQPFTIL
jgi:hypothetical protein